MKINIFAVQGMSPDVVTYTTLMKALIKAEQLDQVRCIHLHIAVLLHLQQTIGLLGTVN